MKKNKMMRIASVLLVAVILTTCAISGTYAKYTTDAPEVKDGARVAKWGVTVSANAADLFADAYFDEGSGNTKTTYTENEELNTITVQADTQNVDIFAPGTKGSVDEAIKVEGKPEVDVSVDYSATVSFTGWTLADTSFYCPLVFTINGTEIKQNDTTITNATQFAAAIEDAIENLSEDYHTNTDLSTKPNNTVAISWEWPFEVSGNDAKDTYLGTQAASDNSSKVSIKYSASVTQID